MHVGWIGLGEIGTLMAGRVLAAGFKLTAYARGKGQDAVRAAGGILVDSYETVAAKSDLLCVNVFNDAQVRDVLAGPGGAFGALKPGSVVAIHTTGSPKFAQELGALATPGVAVLDATFSGGPGQAAEGSLTLMVGGASPALERARLVFETYAQRIIHVGALGAGQTYKLLNNVLFAANIELAAAALRTGAQLGLDPAALADVLGSCSGGSFGLAMFARHGAPDTVLATARPYLDKDVATARAAAADAGIDLGLLAQVTAGYGTKNS